MNRVNSKPAMEILSHHLAPHIHTRYIHWHLWLQVISYVTTLWSLLNYSFHDVLPGSYAKLHLFYQAERAAEIEAGDQVSLRHMRKSDKNSQLNGFVIIQT